MNPLLRSSAAHVFVPSFDAPSLDEHDDHHLRRALRLRPGSSLSVSDGLGRWAPGELTVSGLRLTGEPQEGVEPFGTVACAVPKGDRVDFLAQKLTELNVAAIYFVEFDRSVVRWTTDRAGRQLERLRRIAREACMQSRRCTFPVIDRLDLSDPLLVGPNVAVADLDGSPPVDTERLDTVVIGPEGGFVDAELVRWQNRVRLADTVLRTETAAVVAATVLAAQ
jgi:16S rRNA (uracil1498-N3)-methyltransferase